jgi:hypothetical protein
VLAQRYRFPSVYSGRPHLPHRATPDSRCRFFPVTCLRRDRSPSNLTSRSWVSAPKIAGHYAGYLLPCHSRSPASRGECSTWASVVHDRCSATGGRIPPASHSLTME